MRTLRFYQVDVFADAPFAGNPLAVFVDADGLTADEMQAVAREMNLSETTFVSAPEQGGSARVRIFTPAVELPFAGHPSVGTACQLVRLGIVPAVEPVTRVVLELGVGPTAVEVEVRDGEPRAATVHQGPPRFGADIPREEAAGVLGLSDADLHPAFEPAVVGTGLDYAIIPLRARAALGRIALDMGRVAAFEEAYAEVYPCAFEADDAGAGIGTGTGDAGAGTAPDGAAIWVEARGLFPLCGIPEDPATGSAAGPLAAYFARAGVLPPGETRVVLQGAYVGRPSHLTVSVVGEGGRLEDVLVGGAVRPVLWGELTL